jgi:dipeptidyl-peptidase-4
MLALSCLAQEGYFLKTRDQSRLEYYQKAGLSAEVLVEDILVELAPGNERMLSAGSWILLKKDKEPSAEVKTALESETFTVETRILKTVPARPLASERTFAKPITFNAVQDRDLPNFGGSRSMPSDWLPKPRYGNDEEYLQSRYWPEFQSDTLCVIRARTGKVLGPLTKERKWNALKKFPAFESINQPHLDTSRMNADFTATWLLEGGDIYYARLDGSMAGRLTHSPQPKELIEFSPDGRFIAYVSENNLWVVDVNEGTPRSLTRDGSETILNGKCSWVYYEEVYRRNWKAFWWSPDSRQIIFYRSDESTVPIFTLIDDISEPQRVISTRYPRAGEPNPRVTLGVVGVTGGNPRWMDLKAYAPESCLVVRAGFTQDNKPWYAVQDRAQKWLDFWVDGKKQFRDSTPAWIEPPLGPVFLSDGSWIASSTRGGFNHFYLYDPKALSGKALDPQGSEGVKVLTQGNWEVRSLVAADEAGKWLYFTATRDNLIAENFYRVNWQSGSLERLSWEPGTHSVSLSPSHNLFADSWSGRLNPGSSLMRFTDGAGIVRTLHSNPVYALEEYTWGKSEQFSSRSKMAAKWKSPGFFRPVLTPAKNTRSGWRSTADPRCPAFGITGMADGSQINPLRPRVSSPFMPIPEWPAARVLNPPGPVTTRCMSARAATWPRRSAGWALFPSSIKIASA